MNRKRCPWCGKTTDKYKDKDNSSWNNFPFNYRLLHLYIGKCSHCQNKYGQYPNSHNLIITLVVILLFILAFVFGEACGDIQLQTCAPRRECVARVLRLAHFAKALLACCFVA